MNKQDENLKAGDTEAAQKSTGSGARSRFRRSIIALSLAAVLGISTISARILSIPAIAPVQRAHALGDGLMQNGMMIMLIMMLMGMMRQNNNNNNGSQPLPNNPLINTPQPQLPGTPGQPSVPGSGSANQLLAGAPLVGMTHAGGNLTNAQLNTQPNPQPSGQLNSQAKAPSNSQQPAGGSNGALAPSSKPQSSSQPQSPNPATAPAVAPSNALAGSGATQTAPQPQPLQPSQKKGSIKGIFEKI